MSRISSSRRGASFLRPVILATLITVLSACSDSQQPAAPTGAALAHRGAAAMTEASYRQHIEILASDKFGGRGPA